MTDVSTTCVVVFHSFVHVLLEILTQIILQSHKGTCTWSLHHRNHVDANEKFLTCINDVNPYEATSLKVHVPVV